MRIDVSREEIQTVNRNCATKTRLHTIEKELVMSFILRVLFAATLLIHFSLPAFAARQPDNTLAESLDLPRQTAQAGVADFIWQASYIHPGGQFHVVNHFPQGLGEQADSMLSKFARNRFDETCSGFVSVAVDSTEEALESASRALRKTGQLPPQEQSSLNVPYYSVHTYILLRPSTRYASVQFTGNEYSGGAHGNRFHEVLSFDLESGKLLELDDFLPDGEAALTGLINRIADGVQALKDKDAEPVNRDPAAIDVDMERIALTPEGIRVIYDPYEMGSYAEGDFFVDIPREELIKLGVKPDFWTAKAAQ